MGNIVIVFSAGNPLHGRDGLYVWSRITSPGVQGWICDHKQERLCNDDPIGPCYCVGYVPAV